MAFREPFEGPRLKVERAKRHIADYRAAFRALDGTDFVELYLKPSYKPGILAEPETKRGDYDIRLKRVTRLPSDLALTAADAIYNLRSALDQAASRCAEQAGETPDQTYFPHGLNEAGFQASLRKKCQEIPESVRDAITRLQPYYGGHGELIRALHDLNLVDKHTDLLLFTFAMEKMKFGPASGIRPFVWNRGIDEAELAEHYITNADDKIKVTCTVAFSHIEILDRKPVTQVLNQLCDLVSRIIDILEEETSKWLALQKP